LTRSTVLSRWLWLVPVVVATVGFHFTPAREALDRAFFDAASRHPLVEPTLPENSALVLIDESTMEILSREGYGLRWPFERSAFAALILGLDRAGAAGVVMDFTFFEQGAAAEQDLMLASIAASVPSVVLARTAERAPVFWDEAFVRENAAWFEAPRAGRVELTADADGVTRRYAFPGSLAAVVPGQDGEGRGGLLRWHGGLETLRDRGVPVLSAAPFIQAGLTLYTRIEEASPHYAPAEIAAALAREPPLSAEALAPVKDRVVFVGASASGTFDVKPLPVGELEPGVLLHWTAWANQRADEFIAGWPGWVSLLVGAAWIGLLALAGTQKAGWAALALLVATGFAAYAGLSAGVFFAPATPVAATLGGLLGVVADGFLTEQRRRREVQAMFGSYVDPAVVEQLVRDPQAIRLGGEKREATVFFCDLAGFTDLSEQVSPEELLALINRYLEETSDCLLAHGAYIDKYIGDAVMAVFGAPQRQPDHAVAAGRAALAAQAVLTRLNVELSAAYGRTLRMRIGLNSGEMIVGNLGSERKRNYTVLGDAVNLASRLEGANKEFGTAILVGEETARRIGDALVLRPLTRLRVKGKQRAVEVSELVGEPGRLDPAQEAFLAVYRPAYDAYAARRFAEAADGFARAAALVPQDRMTQALLADALRLAQYPPPSDWEPVLTLESK
jgi:adenylate cyclase